MQERGLKAETIAGFIVGFSIGLSATLFGAMVLMA
jgi:tetrahydromethanopterin S-methyltransferase subunit F